IKGKVFVHTGLGSQEKSEFDSFIFENGGTVRKSTVLNTDYLVYNADYDHETVKLRKARELKEKGSGIEILTTEEWKKLIDS
ncbi:MAG: BRCT domain-containing protein, partial [[Eubacterium] siraeum]